MTVRVGVPADYEPLYQLLLHMHRETALFPLSEARARATIAALLSRSVASIVGVIDNHDGDGLVAAIGLVRSQFWYSEAHHFEDVFTFVHPDHRKTDYAQQLLRFVKAFSDRVGEPVFPGVFSSKRTLGKIRLYSREMPLVGALFAWPPTSAGHCIKELKLSTREVGKLSCEAA